MLICEVPEGSRVILKGIAGGRGLINRITGMGINIGDEIDVIQNRGGPIVIAKGSVKIALGYGMGKKIFVEIKGKKNG